VTPPLLLVALVAAPPDPGIVIERATADEVSAIMLNDGDVAAERALPASVVADAGGPVTLTRTPGEPARVTIPAHGFVRVRYVAAGHLAGGVRLTVPGWNGQATTPIVPSSPAHPPAVAAIAPSTVRPEPAPGPYRSADNDGGNRFLANLSAYEPIYAVYGPGTDSDARLQISFKYQLLGRAGDIGAGSPWANGIHFAFTERLYWNLGAESSPFRNVDYLPELFYLVPARPLAGNVAIGGQAGFRHESNGRAGSVSRSFNTIYVQPVATVPLGAWKLALGPRLWAYVGSREDNPDIRRYRGNAGLFAEIGQDEGWRLSVTTRLNPGSGKGAVDALVSYPLDRLVWRELKLYAFGQAFAGYGENLLDYDRRTTRLRLGVGLVR
jgi:outer membrane phospholipase A